MVLVLRVVLIFWKCWGVYVTDDKNRGIFVMISLFNIPIKLGLLLWCSFSKIRREESRENAICLNYGHELVLVQYNTRNPFNSGALLNYLLHVNSDWFLSSLVILCLGLVRKFRLWLQLRIHLRHHIISSTKITFGTPNWLQNLLLLLKGHTFVSVAITL